MTSAGPSLTEIKQLLQANIESLAATLVPGGSRQGRWWLASNPKRDDAHPSFGIGLAGDAPGAWKDFATGDKGDVLQLIQYVEDLPDIGASLQWARGWLGIDGAAPPKLKEKIATARADSDARAREQAERLAKWRKAAKAIYLDSKKLPFAGSPADFYLRGRGIDLRLLPARSGRLRGAQSERASIGSLGWLPEAQHRETGTAWPALVAAFTADDGNVVAVHRTFLSVTTDTPAVVKAPVTPVRKIWPAFHGAAIRMWRGASGLSIKDAEKNGLLETLVLTEGVEDALSVALGCPELRVWAAGSLANLGALRIPACCDEVIVCADNDWGKPQAQQLLQKSIDAIAAQDKRVRVVRSNRGKDVNDALLSERHF